MTFYIRKSVKAGPFRFNISKSGVGVSVGVKGFRVGTGPRGNYVHIGRGGFYYRQSLNPPRTRSSSRARARDYTPAPPPHASQAYFSERIESGSVLGMVDSSSASLLEEINEKARRIRLFPATVLIALLICSYTALYSLKLYAEGVPILLLLIAFIAIYLVSLSVVALARYRDDIACSVVILYDFDVEMKWSYEMLHYAFGMFRDSQRVWRVTTAQWGHNRKYHAGVSHLLDRKPTYVSHSLPSFIKTNVKVPVLAAGRRQLAFMPDRLLVFEGKRVGTVSYNQLLVGGGARRFVEDERVPADAYVVDHTWQYVNKDNSPDRRFKYNKQIPVVLYDYVYLQSANGLNELFMVSKVGVSQALREASVKLGATDMGAGGKEPEVRITLLDR